MKNGREQFLDAAVELFSRKGISATSMAEIAASVGVTPAMGNYYFRKREHLLDAILSERLEPFIAEVFADFDRQVQLDRPFANIVENLVRNIITGVHSRPWLPSLWTGEVLAATGMLRERLLPVVSRRYLPVFAKVFAKAQAQGEIAAGLQPVLTMLSIMAVCMLPFALSAMTGLHVEQEAHRDQVVGHALAMFHGTMTDGNS